MSSKTPVLTVIIPCFRNVQECEVLLRKLLDVLGVDAQIIVVVDGLKNHEQSRKFLARAKVRYRSSIMFLAFDNRLGKGGAVREGMRHAKGRYVSFLDSDGVISPSFLPKMLAHLRGQHACKAIIGKRVVYETTLSRAVLSRVYRVAVHLLFCALPWDTQAGIKILEAKTAKRAFSRMTVRGYAFDLDILLQLFLNDDAIATFAVRQRRAKGSGVTLETTRQMLTDTLLLYLRFVADERTLFRRHPLRVVLFMRHTILFPCAGVMLALLSPNAFLRLLQAVFDEFHNVFPAQKKKSVAVEVSA